MNRVLTLVYGGLCYLAFLGTFPYAIGFFVWSILSASTAFCTSVSQLLAVRFLLGVSESVVLPASMRWIRFHFREKERGAVTRFFATDRSARARRWLAAGLLAIACAALAQDIATQLSRERRARLQWEAGYVLH